MDEPTVKRSDLDRLRVQHAPDFTILKAENGEYAAVLLSVSAKTHSAEFEILGRIVD